MRGERRKPGGRRRGVPQAFDSATPAHRVMPVSAFTHASTYPRRREQLRAGRPDVLARVVELPPTRLGSLEFIAELKQRAAAYMDP